MPNVSWAQRLRPLVSRRQASAPMSARPSFRQSKAVELIAYAAKASLAPANSAHFGPAVRSPLRQTVPAPTGLPDLGSASGLFWPMIHARQIGTWFARVTAWLFARRY